MIISNDKFKFSANLWTIKVRQKGYKEGHYAYMEFKTKKAAVKFMEELEDSIKKSFVAQPELYHGSELKGTFNI